jgi:uncharacterized membrane protein SirB2
MKRLNPMLEFLFVRQLHIACVVASVTLFAVRGVMELMAKPWRQWRLLRIAPHVIDTLLLSTALWMAFLIGQYPFFDAWLTAKVLALVAYVLLGMRALSPKTQQGQRLPYFVAALLCVTYIVGVAITHSPLWSLL